MAGERWEEYEDAELVVECLVGNSAAFDGLVARYRSAVLATVLRQVRPRAVAEEICQEAFVRAFRALHLLRDPFRFPAWLHAIARREVVRHGPREARADDHLPLDDLGLGTAASSEPTAWERLEQQETGATIREAMAALPEELQLVLTLHYWAEMPLEQISRYVGRPVSTIKWRLFRARALLRQQLGQPEDAPATGGLPSGRAPAGARPGDVEAGSTPARSPGTQFCTTWRSNHDRSSEWKQHRAKAHRAHA